jgi:hypothetical protein
MCELASMASCREEMAAEAEDGVDGFEVGDDTAWSLSCSMQKLAKEAQGCPAIPLLLHQNVDDDAVLIHSSP